MMTPDDCPRKVLVVEDNEATREALALILSGVGYQVATAANGRTALDQLRCHGPPCLIVLDLMMPVMDGWQFRAEQLRDQDLARIPVIVCSAAGDLGRKAGTLGAVAYIDKPVEPADLLAVIRQHC